MSTKVVPTAAVDRIVDRLDAIGRTLRRLGGIEKQVAALRLEVQSWRVTQDNEVKALAARIAELEVALAGGEGG